MGRDRKLALVLGLLSLGVASAPAEDIYKWTDEQGRVHYSNRGGQSSPSLPEEPSSTDEGWESTLERKRGTEEFAAAADSAINSLQARMIKKKRDRSRAQTDLEATQAEIVRAQSTNPNGVPELRVREANQLNELRKIDAETSAIEIQIGKVRLLKAMGKEQSGRPGPGPYGQ